MRFHVDGWDPSYGTSMGIDGVAETVSSVDPDVEVRADRWCGIGPTAVPPPAATVVVDGVRRLDARVWIADAETGDSTMGLCASYAAGAVCCCRHGAHFLQPEVRRGLFSTDPHVRDLTTRIGQYRAFPTVLREALGTAQSLSVALQRQLTGLERIAAVHARAQLSEHGMDDGSDLLVVDGPITGREQLPRALGFVKSHQIAYLEPRLHALVGRLAAGERTPVFLLGTSWDRYTWYLRLPGPLGHSWSGIARVECAANVTADGAVALANLSQVVLPRFASEEYKDPRAPQNLYPVAALERELRRRLGHPGLLYRALRQAAAAA